MYSSLYIRQWLVLLIEKRQFCQPLQRLCSVIGTIDYAFNVQYYTVYSILYIEVYSTVSTVPYTILYKDARSGIDKYTVYLTEHSSVNLTKYPSVLEIKLGVQ